MMKLISRYLLLLFFLLVPLSQIFDYYMDISFTPHIIILISIYILGAIKILKKGAIAYFIPKPLLIYILIIAYLTISIIWSPEPSQTTSIIIRKVTLLLPSFFFLFINRNDISFSIFAMNGYILGNIIAAILSLWLFFSGEVFYAGRLTYSPEYNPTALGAHIASAIILLFSYKIVQKPRQLIMWYSTVSIFFIVLILSQSQNAIIALVTGGLAAYVLSNVTPSLHSFKLKIPAIKDFSGNIIKIIALFSIPVIITAIGLQSGLIPEIYVQRVLSTLQIGSVSDLQYAESGAAPRVIRWERYFLFPITLTGIGFGPESMIALLSGVGTPHNVYILFLYHTGVIGLILYVIFCISLIVNSAIIKGRFKSTVTWLGIYLVILGIGNDVIFYTYFWVPFSIWILLFTTSKTLKSNTV